MAGINAVYLLDTHALVWAVTIPEQLPAAVREILNSGEIKASVISYWELILKKGRKTALVQDPAAWWDRYVTRWSIEVLPVRVEHVSRLETLAELHRDPFDRMLAAQALAEDCTLISRDPALARYGANVVWDQA